MHPMSTKCNITINNTYVKKAVITKSLYHISHLQKGIYKEFCDVSHKNVKDLLHSDILTQGEKEGIF